MRFHGLQGMEIYSTALWHLQKEVVLSSLAQELVVIGKKTPQAWCVAGNCFSLQKVSAYLPCLTRQSLSANSKKLPSFLHSLFVVCFCPNDQFSRCLVSPLGTRRRHSIFPKSDTNRSLLYLRLHVAGTRIRLNGRTGQGHRLLSQRCSSRCSVNFRVLFVFEFAKE